MSTKREIKFPVSVSDEELGIELSDLDKSEEDFTEVVQSLLVGVSSSTDIISKQRVDTLDQIVSFFKNTSMKGVENIVIKTVNRLLIDYNNHARKGSF